MRLFRHVFLELSAGVTLTIGGMFVLTLPAIAVTAVHKLAGIDTSAVLLYMPLVAAGIVPFIVPLAFLLATVATFGRLAADNEWTAIRMSGRHPLAVLLPAGVIAAALGVATLWLVADFLPEVRRKQASYTTEAAQAMFRNLSPGRTELEFGAFYLDAKNRDGPDFIDAFVYVPAHRGEPARTLVADRVHFQFDESNMYVVLSNAHTVIGDQDIRVGSPILRFALDELQGDASRGFKGMRYMRSRQIEAELANPALEPKVRGGFLYELNYRRTLAAMIGVFLLLGASTGLMLRRGTQLSALAVAVAYALVFYLLQMRISKQLAASQLVHPVACAWFVPVFGLIVGGWLTRRALWR